MRYFYFHSSLPRLDRYFGRRSQVYSRSASLADPYPGTILLEAERRYSHVLGKTGVASLSMFAGWHRSPQNRQYHYTLRGYNTAGWMVLTLEMQARNRGKVFTYGRSSWKAWASKATGSNLPARHFFNIGDHKEVNAFFSASSIFLTPIVVCWGGLRFDYGHWDKQELSLIIGIGLMLTGLKSEMDMAPLMDGDERRPQECSDPVSINSSIIPRTRVAYHDLTQSPAFNSRAAIIPGSERWPMGEAGNDQDCQQSVTQKKIFIGGAKSVR
ncbi:hypothetical protein EDD18DRAFT_1100557 [Armillaria luteobubalina]|uniref:Uncharacterized protein n=1 Tax=Armillaria luteobubalina TaxID=153913 RepID=A0AA39TW11_9AGAR|nr:hypothetical protein EDD18DRAFT_1100557 [Armillaria luteobubalina]